MSWRWLTVLLLFPFQFAHANPTPPPDSYLWLEDSSDSKAINWVQQQNAISDAALKNDPRFATSKAALTSIFTAQDRLPNIEVHSTYAYNFWQDSVHKRGIWRRLPVAQLSDKNVTWETLLDLDAVATQEGKDWFWGQSGVRCLRPKFTRCLISLSPGGGDAHVIREFDVNTKKFIANGFALPEARTDVEWIDTNTLIVATALDGTTVAGYPRQIRRWKRGQPFSQAKILQTIDVKDFGVEVFAGWSTKHHRMEVYAERHADINHTDYLWLDANDKFQRLAVPATLRFQTIFDNSFLAVPTSDWTVDATTVPEGSLIAISLEKLLGNGHLKASDIETVFAPGPTQANGDVIATQHHVYVTYLDNVGSRLTRYQLEKSGTWVGTPIALPANSSVSFMSSEDATDDLYFTNTSFLLPLTLLKVSGGGNPTTVRQITPQFDTSLFVTEQLWATSADGTAIPYYAVHRKDLKLDGSNPTLLLGYGAFQVALTPSYMVAENPSIFEMYGKLWLEKGGVFAVANIRGGGEFGPHWHMSAILQNKQRSFDDFASVAQDLISRKITTPQHLGIDGRSYGGLLVGATVVQHPELFNAVVCKVPLLDMIRYTHIATGASWIGETGDPEVQSNFDYLLQYSPYHNVTADKTYPLIYFSTLTSDDRVGPGHARKMAARMLEQGHQVLFHEGQAGGHTGTSDFASEAEDYALDFTYLYRQLM